MVIMLILLSLDLSDQPGLEFLVFSYCFFYGPQAVQLLLDAR